MAEEITLDAPETRIERFLAAAAGVEGITLDEPVTRIEKYLYKIAQGSGGVPAVEDADKGKYLHANESTGDLEWAEGGSGGGVLVVGMSGELGNVLTLDKTWQEIYDADYAVLLREDVMMKEYCPIISVVLNPFSNKYLVNVNIPGLEDTTTFSADSASGYPTYTE